MRRVAVTGWGCVTPFGIGVEAFGRGLAEGRSATRRLTLFEADESITCTVVAEVPDFRPEDYIESRAERGRLGRVVPMLWLAAEEALSMAGLDPRSMSLSERQAVDVLLGSAGGGIEFAERQYRLYFAGQRRQTSVYAIPSSIVGMLASEVSIRFGFRGMSHVVSNGCTSSTDAIGYAYQLIKYGRSSVVITGGADACITPAILTGYCQMRAVPTSFNDRPERASRPFDQLRDGFVLGEGAWVLVLEDYDRAVARGVRPWAEVIGYGSTCDAYHRVQIQPDGVEIARAIQEALAEAGVGPEAIDYVNLHGTSTKLNDALETKALKLALGPRAYEIPMSATKSMIGHPQGASGAAGVVATLVCMQGGFVHPTINYEFPDPACDLNYVPNRLIPTRISTALCNCISFGAKNSALVLRAVGV
ncbi:MAG: beta-ketoacyl-[acyl-carrier-protein] synthase family protein [Acidobacteria bacterium]|nr:beta-ketoacyl-[acyl-carrier-protein] synthase family protein [Acidobacteriota bacterium]MDW7983105.1 beta-ketoacyl-[acyl-carrier-protein] synthase family protein [Acidobacteriota bacterium]